MNKIKFKDYRCFRSEQTVRLAPLTLLVGENSTGKTSFMALIRALWVVGFGQRVPDFKEEPYELGSFDEIAHYRGPSERRAASFSAEFEYCREPRDEGRAYRFRVTFGKQGTAPYPFHRSYAQGSTRVEESVLDDGHAQVRVGTKRGSWRLIERGNTVPVDFNQSSLRSLCYDVVPMGATVGEHVLTTAEPTDNSPAMSQDDWDAIERFLMTSRTDGLGMNSPGPFASAPVRSRPRRTYEPSRRMRDPEGSDVPMDLAEVHSGDRETWERLKEFLEHFGRSSSLFDEIEVKRLGKGDASPFQVQVRKYGGRLKGPRRNLIDVGYGVSQVLPIIVELFSQASLSMFLLQQPEVHLHPSAQAALGSLFCQVARGDRQLVVETHSDHLLDRVRMDVRDDRTLLKPADVSILYFERKGLDVRIHSLTIDENGNICGAPDGYRTFFLEETRRSLGL